jgi:heavy metal sensor kinase
VSRLSIRWRLALSCAGVLSVILVGFSVAVYVLMQRHLLALTDAALSEELAEFAEEVSRSGSGSELAGQLKVRFPGHPGYELQVATKAGEHLFQSDGIRPGGLPRPRLEPKGAGESVTETVMLAELGRFRLGSRLVRTRGGDLLVQSAVTLAPNAHALHELMAVLLAIGPLALACAVGGGYWLARRALAPVDRMAAIASEITSTCLDRRLALPPADDELGHLARTFNAMIGRLQRSFDEVQRFTADAAHELRTPLAALRTEAEVALRSPRSPDRDARMLENLLEEIERLTRLVSHLLFLSREDTGSNMGHDQLVRLDELVREVGDHMEIAAQGKDITLVVNFHDSCEVTGDADRLRQLFFNLLDNAIKYTPPGGSVTVQGEGSNTETRVTIADTGIGIPADHLAHVFDRFYRVDPSRSSESDGAGLGLSICRSIAKAHSGRVEIDSKVGGGTRVTVALPMRRPPRRQSRTLSGALAMSRERHRERPDENNDQT